MTKKKIGISPLDAAFSYLTSMPRTVREVETYLDKCEFGEYEVYAAVERLKELNYLNDEKFARDFIETRLNTKPVSRRKLTEQLKAHKLDDVVIAEAVSAVTNDIEMKNAREIAEKFSNQFVALDQRERDQRIMKRLYSRGYDFSVIREILGEIEFDESKTNMTEEFLDE